MAEGARIASRELWRKVSRPAPARRPAADVSVPVALGEQLEDQRHQNRASVFRERETTARKRKSITVDQAAALLRVHPRTLCRLLKRREIPGAFVGRFWRVDLADLMAHALKTKAEAGKK